MLCGLLLLLSLTLPSTLDWEVPLFGERLGKRKGEEGENGNPVFYVDIFLFLFFFSFLFFSFLFFSFLFFSFLFFSFLFFSFLFSIIADSVEMICNEDPKTFTGHALIDEDYMRSRGIEGEKEGRGEWGRGRGGRGRGGRGRRRGQGLLFIFFFFFFSSQIS